LARWGARAPRRCGWASGRAGSGCPPHGPHGQRGPAMAAAVGVAAPVVRIWRKRGTAAGGAGLAAAPRAGRPAGRHRPPAGGNMNLPDGPVRDRPNVVGANRCLAGHPRLDPPGEAASWSRDKTRLPWRSGCRSPSTHSPRCGSTTVSDAIHAPAGAAVAPVRKIDTHALAVLTGAPWAAFRAGAGRRAVWQNARDGSSPAIPSAVAPGREGVVSHESQSVR
jgi:hypothetical protein